MRTMMMMMTYPATPQSDYVDVCLSICLPVSGIIMISNVSNESSSMLSSPGLAWRVYFDMDGAMAIAEGGIQRKVQNLMF